MMEAADLFFPLPKPPQQLGMFTDDDERRVERNEAVGVGEDGRSFQKARRVKRVRR